MRKYRDIVIVVALFAALAAFLALVPAESGDERGATSHSSAPGGALALYRWLGALGYRAERLEYRRFALDDDVDLLIVLAPADSYTRAEAAAVRAWVEAGGTLILADDRRFGGAASLLRELAVTVKAAPDFAQSAPLAQPIAPGATIAVQTGVALADLPANAAPLVGAAAAPLLAGAQRGAGYVYVSSALRPLTNAGLGDPGSPALVLSLLRRIPAGGRVLFDEYHHGFVREPSLGSLLTGSPWGWALIYAGLVATAYVVLIGRRFGRPVALREETARRSSAEYLESMAGLLRRGRKGDYLLAHYRTALKRRLARPHSISPDLDDAAFVAALAAARPLDAAALTRLLAAMRQTRVGEAEMLRLIAAADRFS